MLKIFCGQHRTKKNFNMKILITRINLWNEFSFLMWGDDAVKACTSNLAVLLYYCNVYLLITAQITVHDSKLYTTATQATTSCVRTYLT